MFFLPLLGSLLGSNLLGGTLAGALGSSALGSAAGAAIGSGIGSLAQGDDPTTALLNAGMSGAGGYVMDGGIGGLFGGSGATAAAPAAMQAGARTAANIGGGAAGAAPVAAAGRMAANIGAGAMPASSTSATGGIMGWIKDNPLLAAGGAALALPMLTGDQTMQTTEASDKKKVRDGWKANPYTGGKAVFPGPDYRPGKDPEWDYFAPFRKGGEVKKPDKDVVVMRVPYIENSALLRPALEGYLGEDLNPYADYYPPVEGYADGGSVREGEHGSAIKDAFDAMPAQFVPFDPKAPSKMLANGQPNPDYTSQMASYKPPSPVTKMSMMRSPGAYISAYRAAQNSRNAGGLMPVFQALAQRTGMNNIMGDVLSGGGPGAMSGIDLSSGAGGIGALRPLGRKSFVGGGPVEAPSGIEAIGQNIAEGIGNNVQGNIQANRPMEDIGRAMGQTLDQSLDPRDPVVIGVVKAIQGKGGDPKPAIKAFIQRYGADKLEHLMAIYGPGGIAEKQSRQVSDGMSDSVPAMINGQQPAALSEGEFVVPSDVVSGLGNGSTKAGAQTLQQMVDRIRQARTGTAKQPKALQPMELMPA